MSLSSQASLESQSNPLDAPIINDAIQTHLTSHILAIVCHLLNPSLEDNAFTHSNTHSENKRLAAPGDEKRPFLLLLVGEITSLQKLATALQSCIGFSQALLAQEIIITTFSIQDFTQASFLQRYDLGCFIHPWLTADPATATITTAQLNGIAMRLRDLFAQQSLLFMPVIPVNSASPEHLDACPAIVTATVTATPIVVDEAQKARVSDISGVRFDNLGYTLTTANTNRANTAVACWQFNLYDYKPQPAWLNSRYWANPENFDKFRW